MIPFIAISALLATVCLPQSYTLEDTYAGNSFFDAFDFTTWNNGCGQALDYNTAQSMGLINTTSDSVYIGVDHSKVYSQSDQYCRGTVQINTKKQYNSGLFVLNATHLPYGCGTWPAWWLMGPNWPYTGEIDIIENINLAQLNQDTLHTGPDCDFSSVQNEINSELIGGAYLGSTNCSFEPGCGTTYSNANSYGPGFDSNGGGIWTLEWDPSSGIKSWFFPTNEIPSDLKNKNPNPNNWGPSSAYYPFGNYCQSNNFKDLSMYIDIYFCGWAGDTGNYPSSWSQQCTQYGNNCETFVKNNPDYFKIAYWEIAFIDVYQK